MTKAARSDALFEFLGVNEDDESRAGDEGLDPRAIARLGGLVADGADRSLARNPRGLFAAAFELEGEIGF